MDKLTDKNDENNPPEYLLYPAAFAFISLIRKQLSQTNTDKSVSERLHEVNWIAVANAAKDIKFNFYLPKM